jgi:hypothetical protein
VHPLPPSPAPVLTAPPAQVLKASAALLSDGRLLSRVCDEAAFQYSLRSHPNVVRVFGMLRDERAGVLGIVLERCACSLADVLYGPQSRSLPSLSLATKLDIMLQVRQEPELTTDRPGPDLTACLPAAAGHRGRRRAPLAQPAPRARRPQGAGGQERGGEG